MKKTTITISYDEEKISALKLYLDQRGTQIEDELTKSLDTLFNKAVPAGVREYLDLRSGSGVRPANGTPPKKLKTPKLSSPPAVCDKPREVKSDEQHRGADIY